MNTDRIKVTVMSRRSAIQYCKQPHETPVAIISIETAHMPYADNGVFISPQNGVKNICRLSFADADNPGVDVYGVAVKESDLISRQEASLIYDFVSRNRNIPIIVHCDAGISRSSGVAAAILKAVNNDDSPIFDAPKYRPNMRCYRTVLNYFEERKAEVLEFINIFRNNSKDVEYVFLNGQCYWFARILKLRFAAHLPVLYYIQNVSHFLTEIGGNFYDITGQFNPQDDLVITPWQQICEEDSTLAKRIVRDCILENNEEDFTLDQWI